ncbi:hypothetical protein [Niallia endozanthoxylica]|uniref:hypothetical protein n=1 Tax=Niallia endozanthoxylica TaxID=2036016 RepID=UPI00168B32B0|nr:hypothetical protein [Niallia endozanthoxylica]
MLWSKCLKLQIFLDQLDDHLWSEDEKERVQEKATSYLTQNKGSKFKKDKNPQRTS